jgi:pimeloyl-ACP methyl ester carboxylesterase
MTFWQVALAALLVARPAAAQESVSFPTQDGGEVSADIYGTGDRGIVLAHGGRFNKGSWAKQARILAAEGFRVMAIDFRGYGQSRGPGQSDIFTAPLHLDVLAAVRFLRTQGVKQVSLIGGSLGGGAAATAWIESDPGEIDRLVLLGATPQGAVEKFKGPSLFIVAKDDANADGPRLPGIRAAYERAPQPKKLMVVEGSAHAQFLFESEHGERVMREILRFLSEAAPAAR